MDISDLRFWICDLFDALKSGYCTIGEERYTDYADFFVGRDGIPPSGDVRSATPHHVCHPFGISCAVGFGSYNQTTPSGFNPEGMAGL
ncbi:MAG: hypothetical protein ACOYZ6_14935 [Chloroflexota bacterium]